jgi:hypothetical protein
MQLCMLFGHQPLWSLPSMCSISKAEQEVKVYGEPQPNLAMGDGCDGCRV